MFERFTDKARRVLVDAQSEAQELNHSFIAPEHVLLGLIRGDGVAAKALAQLGVELGEVRAKVAGTLGGFKADKGSSKVPFSPQAKKSLEMSLREALRMGHNYIGTEHVLLGVLRATSDRDTVRQVLGVGSDEIRARVLEVMAKGPTPEAPQSPALAEVLKRARELSGSATMTTGHLLQAMVADNSCQAAQALEMLGVNAESVEARLATVPVARTSDAPPRPRAVEIKLGQLTTTIDDPDLAGALGQLTAEQLAAALRGAVAGNTEPPATEPPASEPPASEPPASAAS